jgi:hypothetical protein
MAWAVRVARVGKGGQFTADACSSGGAAAARLPVGC